MKELLIEQGIMTGKPSGNPRNKSKPVLTWNATMLEVSGVSDFSALDTKEKKEVNLPGFDGNEQTY